MVKMERRVTVLMVLSGSDDGDDGNDNRDSTEDGGEVSDKDRGNDVGHVGSNSDDVRGVVMVMTI